MDDSMRFGLMAVFAVSGSMVFLVHQVHKRLLSSFMEKVEFEMGGYEKNQGKKKVRFAKQVLELPVENKSYHRNVKRAQRVKDEKVWVMENTQIWKSGSKLEDIMPPNRAVLYRGILKYRSPNGRLRF